MNIDLPYSIDRDSWIGALKGGEEDSYNYKELLDEAEALLFDAASPKGIYRIMDLEDINLTGVSIKRHLLGCKKAVVMGLTLGAAVDELIRRTQVRDMALAVILDCGASILTEQMCDAFGEIIDESVEGYTTSRFSPGYGDFPLEHQKHVIRYIDGQRKIGLNVTSDSLMIPRKSVTAIIGISDEPVTGSLATCGECVLKDKCEIRKEGRFCGD